MSNMMLFSMVVIKLELVNEMKVLNADVSQFTIIQKRLTLTAAAAADSLVVSNQVVEISILIPPAAAAMVCRR